MGSLDILKHLIAFPTESQNSNLDLIAWTADFLQGHGIQSQLVHDETGQKANLFATIGPPGTGGVVLSGHSDVVPVAGQSWTKNPFDLTIEGDRLYGRGTADMKGFVACMLQAAALAAKRALKTPLHLALSYDEEVGCVGVHRLISTLAKLRPRLCIVGEPTELAVAIGHKGKLSLRATAHGRAGHSAWAPEAVNAIHHAADTIQLIRQTQSHIQQSGHQDSTYDIPYTTLHVGVINGGSVLNVVPETCAFEFEIRPLPSEDPQDILETLRQQVHAQGLEVTWQTLNSYPGLDTDPNAEVVKFVQGLTGGNGWIKMPYGTEAGVFHRDLHTPTVICGPGSMAQGHKPDEYITMEQMHRCDEMLASLLHRLEIGLD